MNETSFGLYYTMIKVLPYLFSSYRYSICTSMYDYLFVLILAHTIFNKNTCNLPNTLPSNYNCLSDYLSPRSSRLIMCTLLIKLIDNHKL